MYQHDSIRGYAARPKWSRAINSSMARLVIACIALTFTSSPAQAQITLEETVTGGHASASPVTLPAIQVGTDRTYVLAVATKWSTVITAVTGGGLTWTVQVEQCTTGNKTSMRIWTAQGSPGAPFQLQITHGGGRPLTAILSRYSGVGVISDPTGENPAGENGNCSDGTETSPAQLTLTSTDNGSVHVLGVAPANLAVTSASSGYTLNGSDVYGVGGNTTYAYMYEKAFDPAATDTFQATLSDVSQWATGGVVLSPGTPVPPVFADVSSAVGFDVQTSGTQPSGLNFADYDNDGDLDAIITGQTSARLLTNVNQGQSFTASIFGGGNRPGQGAIIDIDNDGDLDFWHADEKLFDNNGSAAFTDTGNLGLSNPITTSGVVAADVDADGYCDALMFSANGNWIGFHGRKVVESLAGTDDPSYGLNDAGSVGSGEFCAAGDVNNDGRLDFYYHYNGGRLFLSDGDGTYTQNASGISVATAANEPVGAAWGDYDNDGDLDLFVPRYASGAGGYLWRNDAGAFTDVAAAAGITNTSGQRGCAWGDYDNDGDLDLYICVDNDVNVLYQNQGDGTFASIFEGTSVSGNSQDAVFVDYDNDGDLDLAVTQEGANNVLLQNSTNDTNYLKVRVIGHGRTMTNTAAIGVRVDLYAADATTFLARREIATARGFGGTEPIWVHFGGVVKSSTYVVKVHFVGGVTEVAVVPQAVSTTIASVTIAQMLTVVEGNPRLAGWHEVEPD